MRQDDREQKLIANLIVGMSKPKAAREAGYSESFARVNVYAMVNSADFQERLARAKAASGPTSAKASQSTSPDVFSSLSEDLKEIQNSIDGLTLKERRFKDFYLGEAAGNGTKAARLAGFAGNDNTLAGVAHHLLKNPKIQAAIRQELDRSTMSARETLERLTKQARGSLAQVLDDEGSFDLKLAKERGADDLLRRVKIRKRIERDRDGSETEFIDHDIEIHNAQTALELMGKHHRLFADVVESVTMNEQVERHELTIILQGSLSAGLELGAIDVTLEPQPPTATPQPQAKIAAVNDSSATEPLTFESRHPLVDCPT